MKSNLFTYRLEKGLIDRPNENIVIYARNPQDIINFVQKENKTNKDISRKIMRVEKGKIIYQPRSMSEERNKEFLRTLGITNDFNILLPLESLMFFKRYRNKLVKKDGLYEFVSPGKDLLNITYIPEDIKKAIQEFDLNPLLEEALGSLGKKKRRKASYK